MTYRVTWKIDIDADSPEEAAQKALEIQRDPNSIATVMQVKDATGTKHTIDPVIPPTHTYIFDTYQHFNIELPAGEDGEELSEDDSIRRLCAQQILDGTVEIRFEYVLNEHGETI